MNLARTRVGGARDEAVELLAGAQSSMLGPLVVVALAMAGGAAFAVTAAWRRGATDAIISSGMDVLFAFPGILLAVLATTVIAKEDFIAGLELEAAIYAPLGQLLEDYDALICPTFAVPALPAEWDHGDLAEGRTEGSWMDVMMTLPFNIASRCPVLSVPSGRAANGVPTGLSVVGKTYDDVSVFRVAAAHEERYPWYRDEENRPRLG